MGVGDATSRLRKAAKKMVIAACGSFSSSSPLHPPSSRASTGTSKPLSQYETEEKADCSDITDPTSKQNLCAICLEALSHSAGRNHGEAVFTGQCSHSFHLSCIVSNVRHGSVTCPVCRALWTLLPRNFKLPPSAKDPVFRILDDSIATFRVHRRSFLRSARYDDDDPIDPYHSTNHPCLDFSLIPISPTLVPYPCCSRQPHQDAFSGLETGRTAFSIRPSPSVLSQAEDGRCLCKVTAFLSVKLTNPQPIDLVLVTSPNGPHLRLLKQSMASVAFSLRSVDRLSIVTCSSAAARVFPLRRMTSCGKRMAMQVIDRLFYIGEADPSEGLRKGIKVLEDRAFKNPRCTILHLSDRPARPYYPGNMMQMGVAVHKFHVGFGVGSANMVMREFEEFLGKVVGGVAKDIQLKIGEEGKIVKVGEVRGGEERRIVLELGEHVDVRVGYSYVEGETEECMRRRGETMVNFGDKEESKSGESGGGVRDDDYMSFICGRRSISAHTWDYHNPIMARRWAKRLHGHL